MYRSEGKMDFVGSGKSLIAQDIQDAASILKVGVAEIRAVIQVEAAGKGFFPDNRPKILFEPHVFYRQLGSGLARDAAVQAGVAYEKWGTKPYPKTADARYAQLAKAMNIDITKALRSASWGLPQILGYNFSTCGYGGVINMVEDFKAGEREQLFALIRLIEAWDLEDELRNHNWARFAFVYNGPRYKDNHYDTKLAIAYNHFTQQAAAAVMAAPDIDLTAIPNDESGPLTDQDLAAA